MQGAGGLESYNHLANGVLPLTIGLPQSSFRDVVKGFTSRRTSLAFPQQSCDLRLVQAAVVEL
jgi:hypothetical protein